MIKKTKFILKEGVLRFKYMTAKECIFCKIVSGKMKADIVLETDEIIAFNDINPVSAVHVLIVPKKHIDSVLTIEAKNAGDLVAMYDVARRLVEEKKLDAFRLAFNGGRFQHVPHLHMHLLAGSKIEWRKL